MEYTEFFKHVKRAAKQTATKLITPPLDWFEMSKEKKQPKIDIVTEYTNNSVNAKRKKQARKKNSN